MPTASSPTLVSLVGARPQFVKVAPVHDELEKRGLQHHIVHSGQHYDDRLSRSFFDDLQIPVPSINLEAGSGSHAEQTARIIDRLDAALDQLRSDIVIVYGDTNTTLAGAVVVSKRSEYLVHVEAGLRSHNRKMPEETNRIVADHLSNVLLAPTSAAMKFLEREGLGFRSRLVGDVMVDVLRNTARMVSEYPPEMPTGWADSDEFVLATLHRGENTDDPTRLHQLIDRLGVIHHDVRLAAHPRLSARMSEFNVSATKGLSLWQPLSYPQTVHAISRSIAVITDSGGLQKEAVLLGRPCITARHETEWVETVEAGWNLLDPNLDVSLTEWIRRPRASLSNEVFGDGHAARKIVDEILSGWGRHRD